MKTYREVVRLISTSLQDSARSIAKLIKPP
jgi:hypothetical protein